MPEVFEVTANPFSVVTGEPAHEIKPMSFTFALQGHEVVINVWKEGNAHFYEVTGDTDPIIPPTKARPQWWRLQRIRQGIVRDIVVYFQLDDEKTVWREMNKVVAKLDEAEIPDILTKDDVSGEEDSGFSDEIRGRALEILKDNPLDFITQTVGRVHIGDEDIIKLCWLSGLTPEL